MTYIEPIFTYMEMELAIFHKQGGQEDYHQYGEPVFIEELPEIHGL